MAVAMPVAMPSPTGSRPCSSTGATWPGSRRGDQGLPGDLEACGGLPDRSVTISLSQLMKRTRLSCPTVIDSLARLEDLGLVVSTTHQRGKVKTYYVPDPPAERRGRDD